MTRLDFYDTDQYGAQSRWEYPYNDAIVFSYNCDELNPTLPEVRTVFKQLLYELDLVSIGDDDPLQPKKVWGYDE
jgi:hypothetical protein